MMLHDRTILVTGASSGIGLAALRVFAEEGASVLGIARRPTSADDEVSSLVREGHRVKLASVDITRPGELEAFINDHAKTFGPIDGAFNNASVTQDAYPIDEIPEDVFDELLRVNIKGTWLCLRLEITHMKPQKRGSIVNTSSIAGVRGIPGLAAYTASKHAILGLTRAAALDVAAHGIRVNCLCPGTTRTPMMERQMRTRPNGESGTLARIPLHRFASPIEQASAAAWLLSDKSAFVTGEELVVDGGATIR